MGMFWNYRSFPRERWKRIFGGGAEEAVKHVLASYMWDRLDGTEPDFDSDREGWLKAVVHQAPQHIVELAGDICRSGFSYRNRSKEEAALLDDMMVGFFSPEGIEDLLEAEYVGGDGIKAFILEELLARGQAEKRGGLFGLGGTTVPGIPTESSRFIVGGRRVDSSERPKEEAQYLIFWDDEVPKVRAEIELLLRQNRPWSHAEFDAEVRKTILAALSEVESSGRCLFGRYC